MSDELSAAVESDDENDAEDVGKTRADAGRLIG